jgi:6-pyruvoyltetrahydropterin/6-carboxytetrahydropterin synthase
LPALEVFVTRRTTIELFKEEMKFSAGHFTIFSATSREHLHGHNFAVGLVVDAAVTDEGMAFDYGILKQKLRELCRSLNEVFLLPASSPHLQIVEQDDRVSLTFDGACWSLLKRDVKILPLCNITLEGLSQYLLDQLLPEIASTHDVSTIVVKVYSGPGQSASAEWHR